MRTFLALWAAWALWAVVLQAGDIREAEYGWRLPGATEEVALWWCSSGWKVGRTKAPPAAPSPAVRVAAAGNEAEAVQVVVRPARDLAGFTAACGGLHGPGGAAIAADAIDILRVRYLEVTTPTDPLSPPGWWPDPLPPFRGPIDLPAGINQPLWVRVRIPPDTPGGVYHGTLALRADGYAAEVPLRVEVFGFSLPDRLSCATAFGFSPTTVFRYHGVRTEADRRAVLERYWESFARHHISPYDPAPLDPIRVSWPDVRPPPTPAGDWEGLRIVGNETAGGEGALLLFDVDPARNVSAAFKPPIPIPADGFRLRFDYRVAVPEHAVLVSLGHHDADGQWMSGRNNDMVLRGDGTWQAFDRVLTNFPAGAASITLRLYATQWTDAGDLVGLAWYDNVSLTDAAGGREFITGGDFEPPPEPPPVAPDEALEVALDFTAWDRAMTRAIHHHQFNTFRLDIPGMGGGTYESLREPSLLGFAAHRPEYRALFTSYAGQLEAHLAERGWLDEAFVYWFDEPAPHQYAFVRAGFARLRAAAPRLRGMLTEQVEDDLIGGPSIWCPLSDAYQPARAEERRRAGETFWWYVCCGPKAPATGLFLDHAGTEMRVWLWQTWQRGIRGILVWQTVYWTSEAAYPDHPQDPYADPMSWVSGYQTPAGAKRPWGNGDGRFLYPPETAATPSPVPVLDGPVESIRWEMLRDGLEDYEYLVLLQQRLEAADGLPPRRLADLRALLEVPPEITRNLTEFTVDPAPLEARRERLACAIAGNADIGP